MSNQSYAEYLQTWQQTHPEITSVAEGQTLEVAKYEQQLSLLWLQDQLAAIGWMAL
jgi:hypothetical protein